MDWIVQLGVSCELHVLDQLQLNETDQTVCLCSLMQGGLLADGLHCRKAHLNVQYFQNVLSVFEGCDVGNMQLLLVRKVECSGHRIIV